jgi:hypothetical protein
MTQSPFGTIRRDKDRPLTMHPLSVEDALRGAMATGKPPEMPKRERPAVKRRLTEKAAKPVEISNG